MAENRIRLDGVETYLKDPLTAGVSTITFDYPLTQDGAKPVPDISYSFDESYLVLTILDGNYVLKEILYLVEYESGATTGLTRRGQEGTSPDITHPAKSKVVHAPTSLDFLIVQEHDQDPHAHESEITAIATAMAKIEVAAHEAKSDPHPQYLRHDDPTFDDGIVIPPGEVLVIESGATLWIKEGATLLVDGTINITNKGRLIMDGKRLIISNTAPAVADKNTVWIQTFGV